MSRKKLLIRTFLLLLVGLPLALVVAVFLAFEDHPRIVGGQTLTPAHIGRARALLARHDPRRATDGQLRTAQLTEGDVNLVASYAADRFGGAAEIVLQSREAIVQAAVPVPHSPFGRYYLNVEALVGETSALPRFESVSVGRLPIPGWLANYALRRAVGRLSESAGEEVGDTIRSVSFGDGLLRVEYEWRADLPDRIKALTVPQEDADRLRAYHERIARAVEDLPSRGASVTELVRYVMQLASERSAKGDAVAENRAAIVALALYVNGKGAAALVRDARDWPRALPRTLLLRGRDDLPKHFTISAALAATSGTPLSDAVGVYKEVDDSRGGSGFSFSDIAADRAGTMFGQTAAQSAAAARRLQSRIGAGLTEADMMPEVTGLPDNMPDAEFNRRFGGVGAPAYNRLVEDIERRVAACPLFQ